MFQLVPAIGLCVIVAVADHSRIIFCRQRWNVPIRKEIPSRGKGSGRRSKGGLNKTMMGVCGESDGGFPDSIVSVFKRSIDGKLVTIPRKVYEVLSHVLKVNLAEKRTANCVYVSGGDAAVSFTAEFLFHVRREIDRTVRSGEVPRQQWERTIWHSDIDAETWCPNM